MTDERDWVEDQMVSYNLTPDQAATVRNLLDTYWTARSMKRMSDADLKTVLVVFGNLANGHALSELPDAKVDEDSASWQQVKPGRITLRDTVRVKSDAYTGKAGIEHNGRIGVVVGIRPDEVRVRYTDDRESLTDWTSHRTFALEKKVR